MTRYVALVDGKPGAYGVIFPDLPGCTAMGRTLDEAISQAAESLRDWTDVTAEAGAAIPKARSAEVLRKVKDVAVALADGASLAFVPLVRETGRPSKANISIDAGILSAIDAEAARRKLTRSAFIQMAMKNILPSVAA